MMTLDEKLAKAKENVVRKQRLEAMLPELRSQWNALVERTEALEKKLRKEQKDVEFFEGGSFASFFYGVTGKKEEKLAKERKEALEAAVKYDVAAKELADVKCRMDESEAWLEQCGDCETEYETLLAEKRQEIGKRGSAELTQIMQTEQELLAIEKQALELSEAMAAGEKADALAKEVLDELDSAEGWGLYDALGGGMLSTMIKYGELDGAQETIEKLQVQLREFRTELTDVCVDAEIKVEIDEFLRFADYFFDGFFTDFAVMDRIETAQKQASETEEKIVEVLQQLEKMMEENERAKAACEARLEQLIMAARV